jgi:hypothetical protein
MEVCINCIALLLFLLLLAVRVVAQPKTVASTTILDP